MKRSRTEIERRLMKVMSRGWASAKDFEARTGLPWRVCARALKRLAIRGEIEMEWHENYAEKFRLRRRPVYRGRTTMMAIGPAWFVQAAGFVVSEKDEVV
jgi:hypothetical protein